MSSTAGTVVFGSTCLVKDGTKECVKFSGLTVHVQKSLALIAVPKELGVHVVRISPDTVTFRDFPAQTGTEVIECALFTVEKKEFVR